MVENVATSYERTPLGSDVAVTVPRKRISWGAVFAGVIIVLAVQLLLSLLGVGIGASTIDPAQGTSPQGSSIGIGAGIWWVVSALIALFAGSWVAGRLAGVPVRTDGLLHGVVTWALATLLLVYLLTTTVSSLIGGAFGIVGSAMQTAGQVAGAAGAAGAGAAAQGGGGDAIGRIQQQADQLLGRLSPQTQQTGQQIQQAVSDPNTRDLIQRVVSNPDRRLAGRPRRGHLGAGHLWRHEPSRCRASAERLAAKLSQRRAKGRPGRRGDGRCRLPGFAVVVRSAGAGCHRRGDRRHAGRAARRHLRRRPRHQPPDQPLSDLDRPPWRGMERAASSLAGGAETIPAEATILVTTRNCGAPGLVPEVS